jgi:hypothetical protein
MKITDLNEFNFYIGNTIEPYEDIVATNDGIEGDDGVISWYNEETEINDEDDLMEVIEDAISSCEFFTEEDREGLLEVFASECANSVTEWWNKNHK